jgi:hypothetical protein
MRSGRESFLRVVLGAALAGLLVSHTVDAQIVVPATVTVDENGNGIGTLGPGFLAPDPGPGGLASVLTYDLSFPVVSGDVFLQDGPGGPILDVIRFNGLLDGGIGVLAVDGSPFTLVFFTRTIPMGLMPWPISRRLHCLFMRTQ